MTSSPGDLASLESEHQAKSQNPGTATGQRTSITWATSDSSAAMGFNLLVQTDE